MAVGSRAYEQFYTVQVVKCCVDEDIFPSMGLLLRKCPTFLLRLESYRCGPTR